VGLAFLIDALGRPGASFAGLIVGLVFAAYVAVTFFRLFGRKLTPRERSNVYASLRAARFQTPLAVGLLLVVGLIATVWRLTFFAFAIGFIAACAWLVLPLVAVQAYRREGAYDVL
jgi:hypothetical protein